MKHSSRCCPFVRGTHRSLVDSPHGGRWRGALMFCLICAIRKRLSNHSRRRWCLRRHRAHYYVTVLVIYKWIYQYGLSVTLLAKAVHGRNLLTVYVRVQWVVSWKFFGSFTPHFSNNNFFTGWYLLTRIAMGPWPVDRFCFGRLWSWSRVQSRENPH